jgi:hypothetical protein
VIGNQTVTRVRKAAAGPYGDPAAGGGARLDISRCAVTPRTDSTDVRDRGRAGVVDGLVLYAPPGADIVDTDQIEFAGDLYDIDGAVAAWTSLTGRPSAAQVMLTRAVG